MAAAPVFPDFSVLQEQVRVRGRLVADTAFRIGVGRDLAPNTPDLPVLRNQNGHPFIPGSSLKGVMRSAVEALARSLRGGTEDEWKKAACIPTGKHTEWCVSGDRMKALKEERKPDGRKRDDAEYTAALLAETCFVCRVFGSPWFAGKVRFRDLPLLDPDSYPEWTEERNGVSIDRDSGTAAKGKLFNYEVAVSGLAFDLAIDLDNPTEGELGLVLMGLRLLERGELRLGGATSRGLGVVRLAEERTVERLKLSDRDSVVAYLVGKPEAAAALIQDEIDLAIMIAVEELTPHA